MAKNNGDGTFTLTYDEFDYTQGQLGWLAALEAAGVDNWEGYEVAVGLLDGDPDGEEY